MSRSVITTVSISPFELKARVPVEFEKNQVDWNAVLFNSA
jgi:hypothetical protein